MDSADWEDRALSLRDGVKLKSRLWYPIKKGPWPVLLMRQPYGREIASTITYAHPSWWAKNGYLVIIQDVRGQGESEGTFNGFQQEASDTTETHKWVRSLPECNGLLGTYGFSYQGFTQLVAEEGSPPPDCIAPAMTGLKENEHWSCEGGAFWWSTGLMWGLQLAAQKAKREGQSESWAKITRSIEDNSYLRNGPELLKEFDPEGMAVQWLESSHKFPGDWKTHQPLKTWLRQPMLLIGGWWDPHLKGLLDLYQQSSKAGGKPELHIGPASHLNWWDGIQHLHLEFFNRYLKRTPTSRTPPSNKILWNITSRDWEECPPINSASFGQWKFTTNGLACIESTDGVISNSTAGKGILTLVHDPWRPAPSIGGHLGPQPGEVDRTTIDERTDTATFTSSPFKKLFRLEGIPILQITASSDRETFDLCIALSITSEDQQKTTQLSTGFLRVSGENARKALPRKIELQPILANFRQGSKLRVSIAGAAWPAIGVNPGQINQPCKAPGPDCLITTICMDLSKAKLEISPLISK